MAISKLVYQGVRDPADLCTTLKGASPRTCFVSLSQTGRLLQDERNYRKTTLGLAGATWSDKAIDNNSPQQQHVYNYTIKISIICTYVWPIKGIVSSNSKFLLKWGVLYGCMPSGKSWLGRLTKHVSPTSRPLRDLANSVTSLRSLTCSQPRY